MALALPPMLQALVQRRAAAGLALLLLLPPDRLEPRAPPPMLPQVIDTDTYEVVVVSPRNHFVFTPMLPR